MSEVGRLVPLLCSSHKPPWDCQAGGVGEDMAAGAVVPTGSLKKKKKSPQFRQRPHSQWPATWAGVCGAVPSRGLQGLGSWALVSFHCHGFSFKLWREKNQEGQSWDSRCRAPARAPGPPGGTRLASRARPHPTHCLPRQG